MQRLESLVTVCLDHLGWAPLGLEVDPDSGHLRAELPARFGGRRCSAWIDTLEDANAVLFTVYAPFRLRPERFEQACLLLNEIGGATVWGSFRLDADDGMVSYDATARFPVSDACGPEGVWNLLRNGAGEFERWIGVLEQVAIGGRSARDVLAAQEPAGHDDEPADDFVSYDAAAGMFRECGKAFQ